MSRTFNRSTLQGEDYDKVRKVIQFIIVEKVDIKLNKEIVTKNLFSHNNIPLSDLQEINVIRLDKLEGLNYNDGKYDIRLISLLKFLKAENQKERDEIAKKGDKMLKEINEFIKRFMKSKKAKDKYMKHCSPWQLGEEYGMYLGKSIGREEGNRKFAKYLEKSGKSIEEISNTMELPVSEIQKLLMEK